MNGECSERSIILRLVISMPLHSLSNIGLVSQIFVSTHKKWCFASQKSERRRGEIHINEILFEPVNYGAKGNGWHKDVHVWRIRGLKGNNILFCIDFFGLRDKIK